MKLSPSTLLLTAALVGNRHEGASAFTLPKFSTKTVDPSSTAGLATTRWETGGSLVDYMNGPVLASLSSSALADPPMSTANTATAGGVSLLNEVDAPSSGTAAIAKNNNDIEQLEAVPTNMRDAVRRFFFGKDIGPILVVGTISSFMQTRFALATPLSVADLAVLATSIVFWWVQEHVLHQKALHSNVDWVGKRIHEAHHANNYHHVSIDSAELIIGWLLAVHLFLRAVLPFHLALSATIGYAMAGLFYEWAHYIVHTKVKRKRGSFWAKMRDNHMRHHRINEQYWLAFSIPFLDDLFGTNPDVKEARAEVKAEMKV